MNKIIEMKNYIKVKDFSFLCMLGVCLLCMYCFGQIPEWNYREIIICIAVAVVLLAVLGLKIWSKIELHKFAFVFIVAVGILSLAIQPILNIPDETVHFARAESVSRGDIIADFNKKEYETIQSALDLENNVKRTYVASSIKGQEIDYTIIEKDYIAESNIVLLYFPQALGILLAKILQLDVIWMLWFARLGNLLCYALGIRFAVKIAPKWKMPLFFVAVLPMSVQQAASCSPDAMINASAFLLIFGILSVIVTVFKVTNIFLAGLILLIPLKKFASKKKAILGKCMIVIVAVLVGGLYYWYTTLFPANPAHIAYFETVNANSADQIQYIVSNLVKWFRGFGAALFNNFEYYMSMLGTFGWVEYNSYLIPTITTFLFAKICTQESGIYIKGINKFLVFLMVMGIYAASCLAMYISWSPVGGNDILGVQGRYFIPMVALMTLLFSSPKESVDIQQRHMGDMVAMLGMNGAMLITTAIRYY